MTDLMDMSRLKVFISLTHTERVYMCIAKGLLDW